MFISSIEIRVVRFRTVGDVTTTTVEMRHWGKPDVTVAPAAPLANDRGVVSLEGSYFIKVKAPGQHADDPPPVGTPPDNRMKLKFWVSTHPDHANPRDEYLLQGIAFSNRNPAPANHLGQLDFTHVEVGMENVNGATRRVFTVTNSRLAVGAVPPGSPGGTRPKVSYDYLFLIQRVSDGAIGIIDPEFENEN